MQDSQIHATAIIEPGAKIGRNVIVEAYAIVKEHVTLEDNVTIKGHVYLDGYTTIGEGTTIYPFAAIGTQTQAIRYQGEKTYVTIGKNCQIREYVSINSSYDEGSTVKIGNNCLIMAYCHVAHHCEIGNNVTMANGAMLAGHVTIEDHATIGGMTPVHQFVRIGRYAFVGGFSRVSHDVPPYTLGSGNPYRFAGLNSVGLKRHGFPFETRLELSKAFKLVYRSAFSNAEALTQVETQLPQIPEIAHFLHFCRTTKRGLLGIVKDEEAPVEETADKA